jgi:hypothetical protein
MVGLEIASTFAFQGSRWLGDTLADLFPALVAPVALAKQRGAAREEAEARIPAHLLYVKGWPTCVPTEAEATLLAEVRTAVAGAVGFAPTFTTAAEVIGRYRQLMALKEAKR